MFVITMGRKNIKRVVIVLVACILLVATTVIGGLFFTDTEVTPAMANALRMRDYDIVDVDDVAMLLTSYGVETDVTSAQISKVTVPETFDDQFVQFNSMLEEAGGDLSDLKGKTVDRWKLMSTNHGMKDEIVWAVVLVRGNTPIGCYLLGDPSGEVHSITDITIKVDAEVPVPTEEVISPTDGEVPVDATQTVVQDAVTTDGAVVPELIPVVDPAPVV